MQAMSHDALHLLWTLLAALAAAIFIAARVRVRVTSSDGAVTMVNTPATSRVTKPEMTAQCGVERPHIRTHHAQRATRTAGASPAIPTHNVRIVTRVLASCRRGAGGPNAAVSASN